MSHVACVTNAEHLAARVAPLLDAMLLCGTTAWRHAARVAPLLGAMLLCGTTAWRHAARSDFEGRGGGGSRGQLGHRKLVTKPRPATGNATRTRLLLLSS